VMWHSTGCSETEEYSRQLLEGNCIMYVKKKVLPLAVILIY